MHVFNPQRTPRLEKSVIPALDLFTDPFECNFNFDIPSLPSTLSPIERALPDTAAFGIAGFEKERTRRSEKREEGITNVVQQYAPRVQAIFQNVSCDHCIPRRYTSENQLGSRCVRSVPDKPTTSHPASYDAVLGLVETQCSEAA